MDGGGLDLEDIAVHLWTEAPLRAEKILDRIIDRGDSLRRLPARGRMVPELRDVGERAWLEVQEPQWRLICRVEADTVEIHGVLDSRRHLDDVLRERMLRGRL